jgi:hypothetical protein
VKERNKAVRKEEERKEEERRRGEGRWNGMVVFRNCD